MVCGLVLAIAALVIAWLWYSRRVAFRVTLLLNEKIRWKEREIQALKAGAVHFACPVCSAVSHNPNDAKHGWCGKCHAMTGGQEW